ncbi:MAG: glycosyltransferase family 4 protein [Bacteroidales bacterium]
MKIAFDAKRAFRNSSGLGNYSRTIIRQLAEFYPDNEYILYSPKEGSIDRDFPPENTNSVFPKTLFAKVFNSYWRSYSLGKIIREDNPDIFHGLSNELPMNIHKNGVKSLVTIHDLIFLRYPNLYKFIDRKIYLKKFLYASQNADKIIAVSEQTKRDIIRFFEIPEEKIEVVYQSWNPHYNSKLRDEQTLKIRMKYDLPSEYILTVGTIEERKNLLQLIKALNVSDINTPLAVVGRKKKGYSDKVYEYIRTNRLENIYFLENVPDEDLPGLYQGASLFVYPSSFEGFGIPVLEAIQSGTPVIAAQGHCLEETGGPESVYIDPFNIEEFGNAIMKVLQNSDLQKKMIQSGFLHAKKFTPEKSVSKLFSVYESLQ